MNTTTIRRLLMAVACAISLSAQAMGDTPKTIDVPAGELIPALKALGAQTGVEFVYSTDQLEGLSTEGVHGELTPENAVAVAKLLEGTKLTVTMHQSGAVLIAAPQAASSVAKAERTAWRLAQSETGQNTDSPKTDSSADESESSSSVKLEEVVVTAQKRTEKLINVPISITMLSGAKLDKTTSVGIVDELNRIPGVVADEATGGGAATVIIRGVTAGAGLVAAGSATAAYYLDAVPYGLVRGATSPDTNVYDLERIEILRGPQGTLYGANALSGVVRILTKDPDLDNFELKVRTSASNTQFGGGNFRGDLAVNLPIVESKLAARALVGYQDNSGWIDTSSKKDANDSQIRNVRLKLAARPTDTLSIGASFWTYRSDEAQQAHISIDQPASTSDRAETILRLGSPSSVEYDITSLRIGYEYPAFSVSSATGYLDYEGNTRRSIEMFVPGVSGRGKINSKVFTEELSVSSTHEGPWRWSLGGLYRDGTDRTFSLTYFNDAPLAGALPNIYQDKSRSIAFFGELTRSFFDGRFDMTGGLRYFKDEVSLIEDARSDGSAPGAPATENFSKVTKRLVLNWHPSDASTIYASYSEGFRSGNLQSPFALRVFPNLPPSQPDDLSSYELGSKVALWDGKFAIDAAIYSLDWNNAQQNLPTVLPSGVTTNAITNAQSVSGMGSELALDLKPVKGLELGLMFGWNDLTFDTTTFRPGGTVVFLPKGERIANSPAYEAGAWVDYSFGLGPSGHVGRLSISGNYISEEVVYHTGFTFTSAPDNRYAEPRTIGRASFAVDAPDGRWSASLFVENITNERAMINLVPTPAPFGTFGIAVRPRIIGVQFDYKMARQ